MKRSEMISKIASVIINFNEAHRQTPREVALEMAETILQVQEEAGMLPPFNDWSYHMDGDRANDKDVVYYSWELKNEEK